MSDHPSFTCPDCGAKSYHPKDVEHSYCGRCHKFTQEGSRRSMHLKNTEGSWSLINAPADGAEYDLSLTEDLNLHAVEIGEVRLDLPDDHSDEDLAKAMVEIAEALRPLLSPGSDGILLDDHQGAAVIRIDVAGDADGD